jgi:hypothetical protein
LSKISDRIELCSGENVSPSSSHDIHSFLCREFARIANKYPESLSSAWPDADVIDGFTKRSAGLFIYADTLIKFVDEGQPEEQLESILSEPLHHESLTASVATAPSTTAASCAATGFRRYPKRLGVGLVSVSKIIVRGWYRL